MTKEEKRLRKKIRIGLKEFFNKKSLENALNKNPILVTALNPIIGYAKAAAIAKKAYRENRPIIEVAMEETDLTEAKLKKILDPSKLTKGGIN
jgi:fumarate hydratase class II